MTYIFSDVDGTLIHKKPLGNDGISIPNETNFIHNSVIDLLGHINSFDFVRIVLISGRRKRSYDNLKSIVPHKSAILEHGSLIIGEPDSEKYNQKIKSFVDNESGMWELAKDLESKGYMVDKENRVGSIRIKVTSGHENEIMMLMNSIQDQYGDTLKCVLSEDNLDFISIHAGKIEAIQFIAHENSEFIAFGNDFNDIEMLSAAKLSICHSESVKEVKDLVHDKNGFVATKSDHQGTIEMLEYLTRYLNL